MARAGLDLGRRWESTRPAAHRATAHPRLAPA